MKPKALLFSALAFFPSSPALPMPPSKATIRPPRARTRRRRASPKLLDFELDGEVLTASGDAEQTIEDQMLFTIGQLNGRPA